MNIFILDWFKHWKAIIYMQINDIQTMGVKVTQSSLKCIISHNKTTNTFHLFLLQFQPLYQTTIPICSSPGWFWRWQWSVQGFLDWPASRPVWMKVWSPPALRAAMTLEVYGDLRWGIPFFFYKSTQEMCNTIHTVAPVLSFISCDTLLQTQ